MRGLYGDVRDAWRMLSKTRGATFAAVVAFALGLGGNAAIYSVCDVLLFRPLLLPELDRLVVFPSDVRGHDTGIDDVAPADFRELRTAVRGVKGLSAIDWWSTNLTGAGEPRQVQAFKVSASFFDTLGASPSLGRTFAPGEDEPGHDAVAVLSQGLWRQHFGGDPGIVGRRVRINDREHEIVGVMPLDVRYPAEAELWVPLAMTPTEWDDRKNFYLTVVGRLNDGVPLERAGAELATLSRQIAERHRDTHANRTIGIGQLRDSVSGKLTMNFTLLVLGVVIFVLLIACANVANLQFARVTARGRELAVRAALGASRWRLARQLIVESVLLALIAATASLFFAMWAIDLMQVSMPPGTEIHLPAWHRLRLNTHALAYTLVLAIGSGLIAGFAAAWVGARGTLLDTLREGTRSLSGRRHRIKSALVVCQLVLALVLLVGAGLMIRGFAAIARPLPGTHPEQVLTFSLTLPESKYPERVHRAAFSEQLLERLRALPEAQSASLSSTLPYSGIASSTSIVVETQPEPKPSERPGARYQAVSPGLFATIGTPMRRGRDFTDADRWGTPDVAIVNETFVRRFMRDHDPIGRRIRVGADETKWLTIVGVVSDVLHDWVDRAPRPTVFRPIAQAPRVLFFGALRTRGAPLDAIADVRAAIRAIDPDQPIADLKTFSTLIADYVAGVAYVAALMGAFGLIAVSLAVIGIYSVMSYYVTERTREIGIRVALGATLRDVFRLIVGKGAILAGIGLVLGLGLATLVARWLASLLYGVGANDVVALGGVTLLLAVAALAACAIPAHRAARVDPLECLRTE